VKTLILGVVFGGFSVGCLHTNSGLPPPLRYPVLEANSPAAGLYHSVAEGETVSSIARAYNADPQQLAEVNNLQPPYTVQTHARLFIPGASQPESVQANQPASEARSKVVDFSGIISWPAEGKIVSVFGVKGGVQYNGISIEAAEGTPVKAADNGKVGYVGSIPGYGNVVLIEHANRLVTVYGHLKEIKTSTGRLVNRGEMIGTIGASGRASSPCLYFEVRSRSKPRNPLFFLTRKA
jgi:lipoprotein NlpD